jgi:predicted anti-sigma-YlaC factor YlaD
VECEQCRNAVSARFDGEAPGAPDHVVDDHLARCASCQGWADHLRRVGPVLRLSPVEPVPDLSGPILAAAAVRRRRMAAAPGPARVALALVGVAQLVVALPGLLGDAAGATAHVARDHGSWELALAAGLLFAALRPARATGLLPVLAVLTAALFGATAVDVLSGLTTASAESSHLLPLTGLAMLVILRRSLPEAAAPLVTA